MPVYKKIGRQGRSERAVWPQCKSDCKKRGRGGKFGWKYHIAVQSKKGRQGLWGVLELNPATKSVPCLPGPGLHYGPWYNCFMHSEKPLES